LTGTSRRLRGVLRGAADLAFFAALAAFLHVALVRGTAGGEPALNGDTARDFLLARQCVEGEACVLKGAPTSAPGLSHGGMWVLHLALAGQAGLSVSDVYHLALWLFVAAEVLLILLQERLFPGGWLLRRLRAAAMAGVFAWAGCSSDVSDVFADVQVFLPSAAVVVAAVAAVCARSVAAWAVTGLAFAVLIQGHASGALYAPVLAGLLVAFPPARPLRAAAVATGTALLSVLLLSRDAALGWPGALAAFGGGSVGAATYAEAGFRATSLLPLTLGGGMALALVTAARRTWRPGVVAVLALGTLPALLLAAAGSAAWFSPHYANAYLLPLRFVAALAGVEALALAGDLVRRGAADVGPRWERLGGGAPHVLLALALVPLVRLPAPGGFDTGAFLTYGDLDALRPALDAAGIRSWPAALARVHGPERLNLASNLQLLLPREAASDGAPLRHVLVAKGRRPVPERLPAGWWRRDDSPGAHLLVVPFATAVDRHEVEVTCDHGDGSGPERWTTSLDYESCPSPDRCDGSVWFAGTLPLWMTCRTLELALAVTPGDDAPFGLLPFRGYAPDADARVVEVTGLDAALRPGGAARIEGGQAGRRGTARLRWTLPEPRALAPAQVMQVLELPLGTDVDPAWLDWLEAPP
jgi:hypothetical protein